MDHGGDPWEREEQLEDGATITIIKLAAKPFGDRRPSAVDDIGLVPSNQVWATENHVLSHTCVQC